MNEEKKIFSYDEYIEELKGRGDILFFVDKQTVILF